MKTVVSASKKIKPYRNSADSRDTPKSRPKLHRDFGRDFAKTQERQNNTTRSRKTPERIQQTSRNFTDACRLNTLMSAANSGLPLLEQFRGSTVGNPRPEVRAESVIVAVALHKVYHVCKIGCLECYIFHSVFVKDSKTMPDDDGAQ